MTRKCPHWMIYFFKRVKQLIDWFLGTSCLWRFLEFEVVLDTLDGDVHHRRFVGQERRHGQVLRLVPGEQVPGKIKSTLLFERWVVKVRSRTNQLLEQLRKKDHQPSLLINYASVEPKKSIKQITFWSKTCFHPQIFRYFVFVK